MNWLERLEAEAVNGDIFHAETEAIACAVKDDLSPYGAISQALMSSGLYTPIGNRVPCVRDLPGKRLQLGSAMMTEYASCAAPDSIRKVILVALWSHANEYDRNLVYKAYVNVLRKAFEEGIASLSLPIFRCAGLSDNTIPAIVQVLTELNRTRMSRQFPVEKLLFVTTRGEDAELLQLALQKMFLSVDST